jgi:hypothetical protein
MLPLVEPVRELNLPRRNSPNTFTLFNATALTNTDKTNARMPCAERMLAHLGGV